MGSIGLFFDIKFGSNKIYYILNGQGIISGKVGLNLFFENLNVIQK